MAMIRKPNGETIEIPAEPKEAAQKKAAAVLEVPEGEYPVPYYNPFVIDERFAVEGQTYKQRFANGRYIATDSSLEEAVQNALRAYGRDKPARWRGDDRKTEWTCKKCGFRTRNDNAKDDHESRH